MGLKGGERWSMKYFSDFETTSFEDIWGTWFVFGGMDI